MGVLLFNGLDVVLFVELMEVDVLIGGEVVL